MTKSDPRMTSTSAGCRPLIVRTFSDAVPATRECRARRARLRCPLLVRIAELEEMVGIVGKRTLRGRDKQVNSAKNNPLTNP